ncbi:E3 SUMO-protein ligase ZBED1-like [Megalobrama amblycephala]|uniref:E3 SUMO-protein ligase ZBED1-like n=1 Tax=Megalobrama amblycephala TaxID=75352 RepID=UPI002013FA50|nr:E3 SUMO-protein ligase ZBED1-like [Megalobrama amblycephala]
MAENNKKLIKDPPASFHSKVWRHFGFYETVDGKALDKNYAICKNCFAKIKYNCNTTNLQMHLVRYHGELLSGDNEGKPSQPTITTAFKAKLPFGSPRAQSITKSIAEFICKDLRPYSVVENDGFCRMLTTLEPRYEIPSRRHFTDKVIPALYADTRAKVEGALRSAKRVALTCDGWTSRATESFVTITAHFIDDNWDAQSYVLQTRAMNDSHTGAHMAEVLKTAVDEWKLTEKEPAVVTDNAANMSVAVEIAGYPHVRCFAHVLNLAVQRALKLPNVARLLGRIRRICTFFHRSTSAAEALKRNQKMLGLPHHKLITDVVVRWNSAYEMISQFLEQQPAVTAALLSPEVRKNTTDISTLTDGDIKNAEEVVKALHPMLVATKSMCEEKSPTVSIIAPLHAQLLSDTLSTIEDAPLVKDIKCAIHGDLSKRYMSAEEKNFLYVASALDPRFNTLRALYS